MQSTSAPTPATDRAEQLSDAQAAASRHIDFWWLALVLLAFVASGLGLRDPWPADEPRFVAVAREMVASGDWLFPRVGGDLYQDKPPLFFWLLAAAYTLTGSVRWSFLLPSFLAACGTIACVYDLSRRVAGRAAALAAAITLACTIQFVMATRAAQIDATLLFLSTFSLYALLRHLLFGPAWGWYFIGGLAAGLGVITKGVGFLPLLVLLPYALLRSRRFQPLPVFAGGARWALAPAGFLLGVLVWLVPMLLAVASTNDPGLIAYRDEILFQQTVKRYASAWHHVKPWYYFLVEVIPALWLPVSVLLIWLVPRWIHAWRDRDARIWLPLSWALLTLLFFSLSTGKRGIYILPALPAVTLAAAAFLPELFRCRGVQRTSLVMAAVLVVAALAGLVGHALGSPAIRQGLDEVGIQSVAPLAVFVVVGAALWAIAWRRQPAAAWPTVLGSLAIVWSYGLAPQIDPIRSARAFMERVQAAVPVDAELGLTSYKEQFLLYLDRPVVNFGHRRWLEGPNEAYDAARWLNGAPNRVLLAPEAQMKPCFESSPRTSMGVTSREPWVLIRPPASEECAERGNPRNVIPYTTLR